MPFLPRDEMAPSLWSFGSDYSAPSEDVRAVNPARRLCMGRALRTNHKKPAEVRWRQEKNVTITVCNALQLQQITQHMSAHV